MKKDNSRLIGLWIAAGLVLLAGMILSIRSVGSLPRTREILNKRRSDAITLSGLQQETRRHQAILQRYAQYPNSSLPFETLSKNACPSLSFSIRSTATLPTVSGWTARKTSLGFSNVSAFDLGRLLEAGAAATPPWSLLECTLFASPTPGQLARAELVMGTVEQQK